MCDRVKDEQVHRGATYYIRRKYKQSSNKIKLSSTKVLAYDFSQLLVEIGSSLGLWLGLSVVGMLDVVVLIVLRIKKLFNIASQMLVKLVW